MIDFYLNRIEPVTMQAIARISSDHVVHTTDGGDMTIRPDQEQANKEPPPQNEEEEEEQEELTAEEITEKVVELNNAAKKGNFKFYFAYNSQNKELCINVIDKATQRVIRSFGQKEIEEMLKRLVVTSGVIVDYKR